MFTSSSYIQKKDNLDALKVANPLLAEIPSSTHKYGQFYPPSSTLSTQLQGMMTRTKKNLDTGMPLGTLSGLSLVGPGTTLKSPS